MKTILNILDFAEVRHKFTGSRFTLRVFKLVKSNFKHSENSASKTVQDRLNRIGIVIFEILQIEVLLRIFFKMKTFESLSIETVARLCSIRYYR